MKKLTQCIIRRCIIKYSQFCQYICSFLSRYNYLQIFTHGQWINALLHEKLGGGMVMPYKQNAYLWASHYHRRSYLWKVSHRTLAIDREKISQNKFGTFLNITNPKPCFQKSRFSAEPVIANFLGKIGPGQNWHQSSARIN